MAVSDFLDRFRKQQPAKTERGSSGRFHTDGFLQFEELNANLQGFTGLAVFDRMYRTDPDVKRVMAMAHNPVVGGTWMVEPYGGDEAEDKDREVAALVEWALFEFMRPTWRGHLAEALPLFMRSGFGPFEQVWTRAVYDGRDVLVPKKLSLRLPRSVYRWPQTPDGDLTAIVQYVLGVDGGSVEIPASDVVYYRVGGEGDNWEGISLLRAAYKPWFYKDKLEKLDAISVEREAVGVPVFYPPSSGVSSDQLEEVEKAMAGLRTADQGYVIFPWPSAQFTKDGSGCHFEIVAASHRGSGATPSAGASIERHRDAISAAFVAEFMRLGQSGEGARATADVQQDPFYAAVEALASIVEDEVNDKLVARIAALNFPDLEGLPKLKMSKADSTSLTELADYAQKLVTAGALHPDDKLEDYLRDRADLPPADAEARDERVAQEETDREMEVEQRTKTIDGIGKEQDGPPDDKQTQSTFRRQSRPLKSFEQWMSLEAIEAVLDEARGRFENAGTPAALALARDYAARGASSTRAINPKPPTELVDALASELQGIYDFGRRTVIEELARQGQEHGAVVPGTFAAQDAQKSLRLRATLAAQSVAQRIAQEVGRLRLQRNKTQADLQVGGEQAAKASLRAEGQLNASAALNAGRSAEAQANQSVIEGAYYTSVLDSATCIQCEMSDDDVLRPMDDPVLGAISPPNPNCEGGGRCRCLLSYQLIDESAPSA